jgi:hypothetical protein
VDEGPKVLRGFNDVQGDDGGTFVVIGPDQSQEIKSFWYKVRCKICSDIFMLCPVWKNLAAKL